MEKPTASSTEEVKKLAVTAQRTNRIMVTGTKTVFSPVIMKAKEIISSPEFGHLSSIFVRHPLAMSEFEKRSSLNEINLFLDDILHPAAALFYLMGPIDRIGYEWEAATGASVTAIRFQSGDIGTLHLTAGASRTCPRNMVEVVGRNENVVVENEIKLTYYRASPRLEYGRSGSFIGHTESAPLHWEPGSPRPRSNWSRREYSVIHPEVTFSEFRSSHSTSGSDMFHPAAIVLPSQSTLRREATIPVALRPHGFTEDFDSCTLFYDLIALEDEEMILLIGPPLRNLMPFFCSGQINGQAMSSKISIYYLRPRSCEVWIGHCRDAEVRLDFDFGSYTRIPSSSGHELYRGKRVLFTLSKNNSINWIVDWVRFHVANHGADAVLIYDNASTSYTVEKLEQVLRREFPDLVVNLVEWPFKFGPTGTSTYSEWGDRFCKDGAFQDARFRFLRSASSVLNSDIDELVVSPNGKSIFAATEDSAEGYISFGGEWVANVAGFSSPKRPHRAADSRHSDFKYLEPYLQYLESRESDRWYHLWPKWCVVPRRCQLDHQWRNHVVEGKVPLSPSLHHFSYRHFRGISMNWYYNRSAEFTAYNGKVHRFDKVLNEAFIRADILRRSQVSGLDGPFVV